MGLGRPDRVSYSGGALRIPLQILNYACACYMYITCTCNIVVHVLVYHQNGLSGDHFLKL